MLFVGQGVPAGACLKAGEAWLLPVRHTAEEGLRGRVQAGQHILHDMGVDGGILRERRQHRLQLGFLLRAREADAALWQRCQAVMRCSRAAL
jgi:hypothetical protein